MKTKEVPATVTMNQYFEVAEVEMVMGARKAFATFGKKDGSWRIVSFDEIEVMLSEALTKLEDKCGCGKPLDGSPTGLCDECSGKG